MAAWFGCGSVAALEYLWDWVKAVRAKSDELEATAAGMTVAEASALNLFDDDTWAL